MQLRFGDEGFQHGNLEQVSNVAEARLVVNAWLPVPIKPMSMLIIPSLGA